MYIIRVMPSEVWSPAGNPGDSSLGMTDDNFHFICFFCFLFSFNLGLLNPTYDSVGFET